MRRLRIFWNWLKSRFQPSEEQPFPNADYEFYQLGIQYYIDARSSALAGSAPVFGNQFHHAVEMFLKGNLSKRMPLNKLKSMQHRLRKIWKEFKKQFSEDLSHFDELVKELDRFEDVRYPRPKPGGSLAISIDWSDPPTVAFINNRQVRVYRLVIPHMDRFIAELFRLCSMNPQAYTCWVRAHGIRVIEENNPVCQGWFAEREKRLI
jgi:hypothetical protein